MGPAEKRELAKHYVSNTGALLLWSVPIVLIMLPTLLFSLDFLSNAIPNDVWLLVDVTLAAGYSSIALLVWWIVRHIPRGLYMYDTRKASIIFLRRSLELGDASKIEVRPQMVGAWIGIRDAKGTLWMPTLNPRVIEWARRWSSLHG